jgi:hypothetical protein
VAEARLWAVRAREAAVTSRARHNCALVDSSRAAFASNLVSDRSYLRRSNDLNTYCNEATKFDEDKLESAKYAIVQLVRHAKVEALGHLGPRRHILSFLRGSR